MTKELKPCPFCGGDIVHEFETNEIGEPCGDGLYVCQNVECGAAFKFPQDWSLSMSRKDESERRFNTRYKRTCKMLFEKQEPLIHIGKWTCSECGAWAMNPPYNWSEYKFCPNCGAEVVA